MNKNIEYKLDYNTIPQLIHNHENPVVEYLSIGSYADSISFFKKLDHRKFIGYWSLNQIHYFKELESFERIKDVGIQNLEKLALRIYEHLYNTTNTNYEIPPDIIKENKIYNQILEELINIQSTQIKLIKSKELTFPKPKSDGLI